jgi:hypothetical protein
MSPLIQQKIQADILIRDAMVSKCGPNPTVNCDIKNFNLLVDVMELV